MTISPETQTKLKKQVEFYFSDVNVQKDVFLKAKMAENAEGFVPLETLLTFNRVNSLTKEAATLAEALRPSEKLVLSEDGLMVRRREPLPESIQTDHQTVYVKPLPPSATLEELTEFFNQHGTVQAVWRRYFPGKKDAEPEARTKPSVFVVFSTKEEAEAFKATPPMHNGVQLTVEMKTDYLTRKAEEIAAKSKGRKRQPQNEEDQPAATETRKTPSMPLNSSYRVTGCGTLEGFSSVKEMWPAEERKGIRYVFLPDTETALLIFQDAATGEKMVADLKQRGTTHNGKQPEVQKLEEADEKQLLLDVEKEIGERAKHNQRGRGCGRGGGRGAGRRGQKRSRD
ncbi:LA RNA binding protein [Trypanosoma rangeli]|uniref:LA RNA binding protein n=1 Tax=Trypanosoma rangeli TaxID=5698 RepID=A0A3R7NHU1_TRYRA|nr:LA RNA binding protein [Trypanosoma rangeli]RNF02859.1 LA RNA binding protein [Trypanosoma rangeli]|eukprot:RNF02859.1 LA RNA binding protein [Trypanosoma rangeli]